ncbi:NADP-dependent alcohol dehydrogenase [Tulasnella sp. 332]|nr:NADP-dependent alcohol dehydrogenase [Tulasnella sp. 332]
MSHRQQRVLVQPINVIFKNLQQRTKVVVWLYDNAETRISGTIIGFDEFMNVVLDDAEELYVGKAAAPEKTNRAIVIPILPPFVLLIKSPRAMSQSNATIFKGYAVVDGKEWDKFEVIEYQPKTWTEDDVEIAITHCGVCGSDVHTIDSAAWGVGTYPLVPGHEIVGEAIRVGSNVKDVKVGDRVGVGAQIYSCFKCRACNCDNENYCPDGVDTYNAHYPDGVKTMGGYSTAIRANNRFVFPIPDGLESKYACSMLCAGLTVFSPLKRNGCGPGKKVGIVGIGGLGHYAILFAKAMGAEVYAFTHSEHKRADIEKMGADHIILTNGKGWAKPLSMTLDMIISTQDSSPGMPLNDYLSTLWIDGHFITVGLPDDDLPSINAFTLLNNACRVGSSHIGSKVEAVEMLRLAAEKKIHPWIQEMPMKDCSKAVRGVKEGKARYRYVLTQDLN